MRDEYFKVLVDEPMRLITLRLKGAESSAFYTEKLIGAYEGIDRPWLYNRLLDYRQFAGIIEGADVERLAKHWADTVKGEVYTSKIAVLTKDPLTRARSAGFSYLFPREVIRTFRELHLALDWLREPTPHL